MDPGKIDAFDAAGEILDGRSLAIRASGGNRRRGLDRFRRTGGPWKHRRMAFERLWRHGDGFLYGAVNAGGAGVQDYGIFCLVVSDPTVPAPDALAVFPVNSAEEYVDEHGAVDDARATGDATLWGDRADLAVAHLGAEALAGERTLPAIVCRDGHFLETVRSGSLPLEALDEARLERTMRVDIEDWEARITARESLDEVKQGMVAAYGKLHRWRRDNGLSIEDA